MISIFAIPKAFEGHSGVIQRNAIRSWARLHDEVQVILCGDDTGCEQMAREIDADWLGDIARNEYGTPMLDDAFKHATAIARHDIVVYANADIILLPDLVQAVMTPRWDGWLMTGRRVDVDLDVELTDKQLASVSGLTRLAQLKGMLHGCGGMDYFVWPTSANLSDLPAMAVGRPGWDNYFVQHARYERRLPLIDATEGVLAIHQNHDYGHVPGGNGSSYEGPEAIQQRQLLGDVRGSVYDATHCYGPNGLVRAQGYAYRRARWKRKWMTRQLLNAESLLSHAAATVRPLPLRGRMGGGASRLPCAAMDQDSQRTLPQPPPAGRGLCRRAQPDAPSGTSLTMLTRMFWPDVFGGVERRTRHMAEAFVQAGLDVRVVSGCAEVDSCMDKLDPGYIVDRARMPEVGWRWRWRDRVVSGWWAKRLKRVRPEGLVWATDLVAAGGAIKAGLADRLIFNPPWCVAGMHSVYEAHPNLTTLRCRGGLREMEERAYHRARWVVGASCNVIDQLADAYGQRGNVHVVPHGVEHVGTDVVDATEARDRFGIAESDFVTGLVCRVEAVKDIGFLLRAMALAGDAVDRLLIVGDGLQRDELATLANQLGIASRVQWAGRLDDPTVAYRAMDAMVLPSVYEAFGNVILEAMAAGTPVIGRRRCGEPQRPVLVANEELIDHGRSGWLVDAHDPADLANTLATLKGQPGYLASVKNTARACAVRFTWAKTIDAYLALLGKPSQHTGDMAQAA